MNTTCESGLDSHLLTSADNIDIPIAVASMRTGKTSCAMSKEILDGRQSLAKPFSSEYLRAMAVFSYLTLTFQVELGAVPTPSDAGEFSCKIQSRLKRRFKADALKRCSFRHDLGEQSANASSTALTRKPLLQRVGLLTEADVRGRPDQFRTRARPSLRPALSHQYPRSTDSTTVLSGTNLHRRD